MSRLGAPEDPARGGQRTGEGGKRGSGRRGQRGRSVPRGEQAQMGVRSGEVESGSGGDAGWRLLPVPWLCSEWVWDVPS